MSLTPKDADEIVKGVVLVVRASCDPLLARIKELEAAVATLKGTAPPAAPAMDAEQVADAVRRALQPK